ncbi:hypothetical protein PHYC_00375 [Phycisphaerales bacterium]|nr:hypothetical protein PHYC_00375 [Phycisphaerales bacterium]
MESTPPIAQPQTPTTTGDSTVAVVPEPKEAGAPRVSEQTDGHVFEVLRHTHFRTMWFAAFGSYVGNWFEFVAIGWLLSQETKSEDWMALRATAQLCPTLLLGMLAGLIADSVNRRTLLIVTQFGMMVIALAMAGAVFAGWANRWVLVGLSLAQGVAVAFNMPAWQVLTPRLVPRNELTQAITLSGISFNIARVVGPALAGGIMRAFQGAAPAAVTAAVVLTAEGALPRMGSTRGAAALLLFNALTFVVVMLAVLTTPDAPAPAEMRGAWRHPAVIWTRSREAIRWVWTHKGPRAVFLAIVVFAMFATPLMQLMPLLVSEVYHSKEDSYGILLATMGVGAVMGGLGMKLVPRWYPMHHFIPVAITLGGVFILLLSLAETVPWAMFQMFFVGIFWMWGFNSTAAAMQNLVDDQMRGRVSAVVNTIAMGLMPLGTYVASRAGHAGDAVLRRAAPGIVDSGTGTQVGLATTSIVLIGAGAVMLIWRTPEVDGLRPGDAGYDRRPGLWRGITAGAHRPRGG